MSDGSTSVMEGRALQSPESQLCFALYSAMHALGRAYAPILDALGLTYPQYLVMLVLWDRDGVGVGVGDIGRRLFLDSGTLTPLLKRLEAVGLLQRRRNPADERQVKVHLTAAGEALRADARRIPHDIACAMGRSAAEITELRDDLLDLRSSLMAALSGRRIDDAASAF